VGWSGGVRIDVTINCEAGCEHGKARIKLVVRITGDIVRQEERTSRKNTAPGEGGLGVHGRVAGW